MTQPAEAASEDSPRFHLVSPVMIANNVWMFELPEDIDLGNELQARVLEQESTADPAPSHHMLFFLAHCAVIELFPNESLKEGSSYYCKIQGR